MNVKRFTARTSREAFALVRQAFGEDAVVLSTKPSDEGVEVLAMAPDSVEQLERVAGKDTISAAGRAGRDSLAARAERQNPDRPAPSRRLADRVPQGLAQPAHPAAQQADYPAEAEANEVEQDAEQLAMSTLSFQDYVRDRMLRRRQAALAAEGGSPAAPSAQHVANAPHAALQHLEPGRPAGQAATLAASAAALAARMSPVQTSSAHAPAAKPASKPGLSAARSEARPAIRHELPLAGAQAAPARRAPLRPLDDGPSPMPAARGSVAELPVPTLSDALSARNQADMVHEIRAMKGMIEERFGVLAFMEKLNREPRQALLAQKLMDIGFTPGLTRKLIDALPAEAPDELGWAGHVLERNLLTGEAEAALEDQGGVFAMIGSTGVGKTTSTAKLAAAFAAAHGAGHLGLITLDAYRVGAHEQLRAYGRILGVPVHTAHDRASLEDLLELLSGKKMVLIDTAGMAQRDSRCRELLEMLSHRSIQRLLVLDAAAQGETIDDVITAWRAAQNPSVKGVILSKIDEAVKLAPALDALIRHRLKVLGVANGQRVPEDWHRLSANTLMQRALRGGGSAAYRVEPADVQLVFAGMPHLPPAAAGNGLVSGPAH